MHDKTIIKLFTLLKGYGMWTIAQVIISSTIMLWVSADICLLLSWPTQGLQAVYTSWILHLIQSHANN